ncbi:hypothetical protein PVAND_013080 [Polypedilum vanderplanki]|uniref:Elongator complex protein 4 n=1 Tax=Polypedilum vanderplanki TaxID=319348 RepID=A0A9J6CPC9_POLVA|nr:hypothetical protein PVAND_013080 [Polypedilum vanderplanki]
MSSFVKIKKENNVEIAGVKTSIRNWQIVSTGSESFNFILGGGLELNSITLIGEDKYGKYSDILTKLFLADSFHHNHHIYFASLDNDPKKIMKEIPMPNEYQKDTKTEETISNDLRIAFRYQDLPKIDSVQRGSSQNSVTYDLTKKYEKDVIERYEKINYYSFNEQQQRGENVFDSIIRDLQSTLAQKPELLRVCISSIGSPLWFTGESFSSDLITFLTQLKSITRYNNVVCYLTMPLHLINLIDEQLIFKIRRLVDCNINLESFNNIEKQTNAVFKQYHGLLHIKKMHSIAALQSHKPEAFDLAFKLKSNRFLIEKLHLPPELQENDSSEISMSCSSIASGGGNKSLDF